jgi:hypothetical protein
MVEYKENFFDQAYYRLKTTDSLIRRRRQILNKIDQLLKNGDTLEDLAHQAVAMHKASDLDEGHFYAENRIQYIQNSFNYLDFLMHDIDQKNEKYIQAAVSKILFLTSSNTNIRGNINNILKHLLTVDEKEFDFNSLFRLTQVHNLDTLSLYTPRKNRVDATSSTLITLTDAERLLFFGQGIESLTNLQYSIEGINQRTEYLLNPDGLFEAKDVAVETKDDLIYLILLFVKANDDLRIYNVDLTNNYIQNNVVRFKNFIVTRR